MLQRREKEKAGVGRGGWLSGGRDVLQTEEIANTKVLLMFHMQQRDSCGWECWLHSFRWH